MDIKTLNMLSKLLRMKMNNGEIIVPDKYILFLLNDNVYSLRSSQMRAMVSILEMTEFKNLPPHIRGFLHTGRITVPVIDLRMQHMPLPIVSELEPVILVIDLEESAIGLVVDKIIEVVTIRDEEMQGMFSEVNKTPGRNGKKWNVPVVASARSMLMNVEKILKSANFKYILESLSNVQ